MSTEMSGPGLRPHFTPRSRRWIKALRHTPTYWKPSTADETRASPAVWIRSPASQWCFQKATPGSHCRRWKV